MYILLKNKGRRDARPYLSLTCSNHPQPMNLYSKWWPPWKNLILIVSSEHKGLVMHEVYVLSQDSMQRYPYVPLFHTATRSEIG
jgi:hypothetical protein